MSYRPDRLAQELKNMISEIIARELHDPRVGFATVTEVKVSRDLRHVRVYVSVFDEAAEKKRETVAALNHAAGFIRREVFSQLRLRHSPEIVFSLDESVERGDRMSRLLDEISRELPPQPAAESNTVGATPDADAVNLNLSRPQSDTNDRPS
ncbi:MAG TPA: 30S ribosome-binding factor RbfA [Blastocatellia bacterium]|nr:30S ribosome-binding factor RbfA [Blastocatellia bacterium]